MIKEKCFKKRERVTLLRHTIHLRYALRCLVLLALLTAGVMPLAAQSVWAAQGMGAVHPAAPKAHVLWPAVGVELGEQFQALVTGGDENAELEPQETFGTRALGLLLSFMDLVHQQSVSFVTRVAAFPEISSWIQQQVSDPILQQRWEMIATRLFLVVGGSFLASWGFALLLLPLRRSVKKREVRSVGAKIGILLGWFVLHLLPLIVFLGTAAALMDQGETNKLVRFVVMTVVYALSVYGSIGILARFVLAPRTPHLRLLPLSTPLAAYVKKWINAFAFVMVVGFFFPDIARVVRIPAPAITMFNSLVALIITIMTIIVILQKRSGVSSFLRGDLSAAQGHLSLWQSLRLWLARAWHVLAISYLIVGYIVTTLSAGGGFVFMQQGTLLTFLALLGMRFGFYFAERVALMGALSPHANRTSILRPVLTVFIRLISAALGLAGIAAAWGVDVSGLVMSPWGQRVLGSAFSIGSTVLLVVLIYEALHAAINRSLNKRDEKGQIVGTNARARTLLPMLHNAAIIVLVIIVGLVTLSELGINIAPLLAGAGVLGVAVGFGSQTLIKDFLTGLFIILENTVAVGDVVQIGDSTGVVEGLTIRTVRLRDFAGNLHIIPFSDITKVINMTKDFSYAVLDMSVAYDSDLPKVIRVMKETGEALRKNSALASDILEPIEVRGVETFGDSSITIQARMKTRPGRQWDVRRLYNLLIKERFDAEKIEIPFPTVTQIRRIEETPGDAR